MNTRSKTKQMSKITIDDLLNQDEPTKKPINTETKPTSKQTEIIPETKEDIKPIYKPKTDFQSFVKSLGIDESFTVLQKRDKIFNKFKNNIPLYPNYNIMLDTLHLPLVDKKIGFQYLLTAIDLGTNMVDFEPMKTTTSIETLHALKEMSKRGYVKIPEFSVLTDNGVEFKGAFNEYLTSHGIYHKYSQPYRKSQNSPIESLNNIIARIILGYLNNIEEKTGKQSTNWLPILELTRIELNKRRKYRNLDKMRLSQPFYNSYMADKEQPKFQVGDLVHRVLDRPQNAMGTLQGKFRRGDYRYNPETNEIVKIYYMNDPPYERYILNDLPSVSYTAKQLILSKNQAKTFTVRDIIGKKIQNGTTYYKVYWKGQLKKNSTWEPVNNLLEDGLKDYITRYEDENKKKKK